MQTILVKTLIGDHEYRFVAQTDGTLGDNGLPEWTALKRGEVMDDKLSGLGEALNLIAAEIESLLES